MHTVQTGKFTIEFDPGIEQPLAANFAALFQRAWDRLPGSVAVQLLDAWALAPLMPPTFRLTHLPPPYITRIGRLAMHFDAGHVAELLNAAELPEICAANVAGLVAVSFAELLVRTEGKIYETNEDIDRAADELLAAWQISF